jgi:hypothetical protein
VTPTDRALLQELLSAYGPGGQEDEVREVCRRALEPLVDELTVDAAGDLVGLLRGTGEGDAPVVRVMAHMDELAMIVTRVEPDGGDQAMEWTSARQRRSTRRRPTRARSWPTPTTPSSTTRSSATDSSRSATSSTSLHAPPSCLYRPVTG